MAQPLAQSAFRLLDFATFHLQKASQSIIFAVAHRMERPQLGVPSLFFALQQGFRPAQDEKSRGARRKFFKPWQKKFGCKM
ncbi:MAG: hypothetical protein SOY99_04585 [Alloprevotella sp.]|nr:hypothetical protein [Alloprevotella sp.]